MPNSSNPSPGSSTPGSLTPGPATPVEPVTTPVPNPVPTSGAGLDLESLTPEDIQAQIVARERDMKYQIEAIKNEILTIADDVNINGRPFIDVFRAHPERSLAIAGAIGASVGVLLGVWARRRRRPEPDDGVEFVRARLSTLLDEAAWKVARGVPTEDAMRHTFKTVPAVYSDRQPISTPHEHTTVGGIVGKAALGFALKTGLDLMTKRLTGHEETFEALSDAPAD